MSKLYIVTQLIYLNAQYIMRNARLDEAQLKSRLPEEVSINSDIQFIPPLWQKLQYFGHLMRRADSFEKTLMLGKIEGRRRSGWQRIRWLDEITNSMNMGLGELLELVMDRGAWRAVVHVVAKSQTWLSEWTELNCGKKERGTKEPLDEGERGELKSWLKTQHSKN